MSIEWRLKLAEHTPLRAAVLAGIIIGVVLVAILIQIPLLGFIGAGFLTPTIFEYVAGRKFTLNQEGASAGFSNLAWPLVKSVNANDEWILLSPFEAESPLEATRGVKLFFNDTVNREEVETFIRDNVNKDVRFLAR